MIKLKIFECGQYSEKQGDWPPERVKKMVDAYNANVSTAWEAPVLVAHDEQLPSTGAYQEFAYGWVKQLEITDNGELYAIIDFLPEGYSIIKSQRVKYISIEILPLDLIDSRLMPFFKAVCLLGKTPPQIETTKIDLNLFSKQKFITNQFSKGGNTTFQVVRRFTQNDKNNFKNNRREPEVDKLTQLQQENADLKAKIAEHEAKAAQFSKENAEIKAAQFKVDAETFYTGLLKAGKLTPAQFAQVVAIDANAATPAEFRKNLRELYTGLPIKQDLSGNHFARTGVTTQTVMTINDQIRKFQKEKGYEKFSEAAVALEKEHPELFPELFTEVK